MIEVNCLNCGKQFTTRESEIKRGGGKFCCRKCNALYGNKNREVIKKTCIVCNKSFEAKNKNAKYCSFKCRTARNPVNGKLYPGRTLNRRVLEATPTGNTVCYICGYFLTKSEVHHIISRKEHGSDEFNNLSILCPCCHNRAHESDDHPYKLKKEDLPSVQDVIDGIFTPEKALAFYKKIL